MTTPRPFTDRAKASAAGKKSALARGTARAATKGPWRGTIIGLMDAAQMTGAEWDPWRAFWKAVYALPMTAEELAIYQRHARRDAPPAAQVAEAWMCIGRGGGKTRNSALHAVYRAITFDSASVDPGEDVIIPLLASDRRQSRSALSYIRGFNALPIVAPYVYRGALKELVEYRTGCNVEVVTASKRAPRGYSCPTANCDEIAFWENDDDHANPDSEVVTALRGSLGRVTGSVLVALSNPAAPKGELYSAVETYFGKDDPDVLVWISDTLSMNPTYDRRTIARAFKRDPVVAMSEFGTDGAVTFRQAKAALLDAEPLNACIAIGRRELPPVPGTRYYAFIDMAEGSRSGDSAALGIAHRDGSRAVLDLVREVEPRFSPGQVIVEQFVPILQAYGCTEVCGDRHAVGFVQEFFDSCSIKFVPSVHSKSELYAELLPLVNTGLVELLEHPTLKNQLLALERRSVRGGRDSIDHPRGAHDDLANVCAGSCVGVTGVGRPKKTRAMWSMSGAHMGSARGGFEERRQSQAEFLAKAAQAALRQIEREDAAARREAEVNRDGPIIGEVTWHVHDGGG